jgi:dTDP-4-dehydrorhamnose reductase
MRRIFLTGASGFLGGNFCHFHADELEIHALCNNHPVSFENVKAYGCDLRNESQVTGLLDRIQPDVLIHLAALSQPNDCARNPGLSKAINVDATVLLAKLANEAGIGFLFTSTDLVFDGEHAPYAENDVPKPMNLYGEHKAEAEKRVLDTHAGAFICRLPLMYGNTYSNGVSFLQPVLNDLHKGKPVNLFADEFRTISSAKDVCRGLVKVIDKGQPGVYHLGGPERLSRVEMGERIAGVFGFDNSLLRSCLRADVPMPAYRPKDTSLISDKIKKLGWTAGKMSDGLKQLKNKN